MTSLGKSIILGGILILVVGTLMWIVKADWHWFAGGLTIFFGSILAAAVLSAETKTTRNGNGHPYNPMARPIHSTEDLIRAVEPTQIEDDWEQPHYPPPDQENDDDPFYRPSTTKETE